MIIGCRSTTTFIIGCLTVAAMWGQPSSTHAAHCSGKVLTVEVFRDANVIIGLRGTGTAINRGILCNLHHQLGPVLPEACRGWLSQVQAGLLSGKDVMLLVTGAEDMALCSDGGVNTTNWSEVVESVSVHK